MFFLDLKPDKALKRISKRDDQEIFENLDDLMKVREKIKKLSSGWKVINTKGSIDDVQEEMEKYFKKSV